MSIHPPTRATNIHTFHMIFLLGKASQAAYKELFTSLLIKNNPKKQLQAQAWEYISSYLKHYFIPG